MKLNDIILDDCMNVMATIPDKYFELAIVDPPYGLERFKKGGSHLNKYGSEDKIWNNTKPDKKYFDELFRISKNQIIWGGNYFIEYLKNTSCFIVWDKVNGDSDFADCELAWTSFNTAVRQIKFMWSGFCQGKDIKNGDIQQGNKKLNEKRIHPTQKPVALYRWLLQNYAKTGDKIIDTHSGSGSLACACHLEKFDFLAIEKDADYHKSSVERLDTLRSQGTLF
jgi:site-specific DNA-methyltransferase (adenine-specific)